MPPQVWLIIDFCVLKTRKMNNEKLWTKDFVTVSVINFLVFLTYFLLMVVIASYAVDKFQASTSAAGLVAGIFIIGALAGRLAAGRIIGSMGSRRVLIVGTILFVVTSVSYFAAFNLAVLTIIRLLNGIAFGAASNATGTVVAQILPPSRRGEGIGYYSISAVLAVALGPFVGVLLIRHSDFSLVFLVTSILALIGFAIACMVSEPDSKSAEKDQIKSVTCSEDSPKGRQNRLPDKRPENGSLADLTGGREAWPHWRVQISKYVEFEALPISIIILILGFSYSVVVAFISLYAREIQLEAAASLYFLAYAATVLISRPFSGRLLDTRGTSFVAYPCLFIYAIGMLLFSQASREITLIISGMTIGLGYGNFISCAQAIAIKTVPAHRLGLATSTFFVFVDFGFGIGPYLLGALVPYTGYHGLYLMMVGVILAAAGLFYLLCGKKGQPARC